MRISAGAVVLCLFAAAPAAAQIAQLEITVGTSQIRNVPFPVTVTARDAGGTVVDDSSTVISFTGTTGTSTENFGWVQELRGRYIVVRDRDGVETLVPNQNLITNSVINWSYSDQRVRLRLPVMISFQDDPEVALQVLIDAAANHPRILKDPGPVSRLMSFENYGMRVEVRFWIRDPMNGVNNVRSDVNREIWRLFKKHRITIPVQQHEVRMMPAEPDAPGLLRDDRR